MPWFKRKEEETYNEQLLREAGLDQPEHEPLSVSRPPVWPLLDRHATNALSGLGARPQEWEIYTTCQAPDVAGNAVEFAALPEGDLIVDEEQGDADLSPFADAVEKYLKPPYRAIGSREDGALWGVAARQIEVRRLQREGDEFEDVEGETVTRGTRLDGDLWEIRTDRL
jgi:hypothetical protein